LALKWVSTLPTTLIQDIDLKRQQDKARLEQTEIVGMESDPY
jgi:hypothetical protein